MSKRYSFSKNEERLFVLDGYLCFRSLRDNYNNCHSKELFAKKFLRRTREQCRKFGITLDEALDFFVYTGCYDFYEAVAGRFTKLDFDN